MALFNKAGNVLRQTVTTHIINEMPLASPSIFQMIRCMSNWKVFVGGIGRATDDTSLREAFSTFGEVSEARVIKNRETDRSRGFGFVTFSDYDSACDAVDAMDQWELHGRTVTVCWAKDSGGDVPNRWCCDAFDRAFGSPDSDADADADVKLHA